MPVFETEYIENCGTKDHQLVTVTVSSQTEQDTYKCMYIH